MSERDYVLYRKGWPVTYFRRHDDPVYGTYYSSESFKGHEPKRFKYASAAIFRACTTGCEVWEMEGKRKIKRVYPKEGSDNVQP